jgi:hypothetical protein
MINPPKIGIVYNERVPQFVVETPAEGLPWSVESFPEITILSGPIVPSKEYLAVFFPLDSDAPELQRQLSNLFPGAKYRLPERRQASGRGMSRTEDGLLALHLPLPLNLIRHLLETLQRGRDASPGSGAQMMSGPLRRLRIWSTRRQPSDCKLGMRLPYQTFTSGRRMHLSFGEGGTPQRSFCTGNIHDIDLFEQHANSSVVEKVPSRNAACEQQLLV